MSSIKEIKSLLKSLGMKTFINYYFDFEKKNIKEILKKFDLTENWTIKSKNTKARVGISLFEKDLNELALVYIIYKVSLGRITKEAREKAIKIYNKIENDRKLIADKIEKSLGDLSKDLDEELYWYLRDLEDERRNITG